ncbi:hypothetical protein CTEN210_10069 [Chaetoceros tenuissimus]|uniref:Methyltransferase domain-containing protein n=1 Tax=Chaetoceros tenuissimus TaxID=426638 RepID=A0AAD3CX44_9STRA|nr:hypothetical protein CTEN210_10069 [Chaetoceros tenuissimus]
MIIPRVRYSLLVYLLLMVATQKLRVHAFPSHSTKSSLPSPPQIIACSSPTELQRAISFYIKEGDQVLELGSQLTDTTQHLCQTIGSNGKATLIDVKRKEATTGRSSNRDTSLFLSENGEFVHRVTYKELEHFDQWRSYAYDNFDVMILDAGTMIGNDLHLSALTLANEFIANQMEKDACPRVVIVKSKTLSNLARRIIHSQRLLDGTTIVSKDIERSCDPLVVPCVGVNEYRRTIPFLVKEGDEAIEVGSHFGRTTKMLHDAVGKNGFAAGVDIGPKIIANAKQQYPDVPFEVVDAWKTLELLKVKIKYGRNDSLGYDVCYADIGGLSGANGLLESLSLLDSIAKATEPRTIVIKSLCMNRLASQLIAFSSVWNKISSKSGLNS